MTHPRLRALALGLLIAPIAACAKNAGADNDAADSSGVRVEGQRLILPPKSSQLASLSTTPVSEAGPDSVRLPGRLAWDEDATVRVFSPFAGRVVSVQTDAGRDVHANDVLALIAAPDFGQAQADARRAATDLALAERTATRTRDLFQHGVVAQKDVDAAEADLSRARAEQQRAQARLALYGTDSTTTNQVFPLRTPLAGTVVERTITPGQEVRPDQMLANAAPLFAPLFVVTDPSRLWVVLDLPEADVRLLNGVTDIEVHTQAWPNRTFGGRITFIASAVDPNTRTVKVRGTVLNPAGLLKAEMLVTVAVPTASRGGLAVPAGSVLLVGDAHVVFVDEGQGRLRRVPVVVGPEHDGLVPVVSGLARGERVVTGGALLVEQLFQTNIHP